MKIIFLDIDGVLNSKQFLETLEYIDPFAYADSSKWIDPKAVARVNRIIQETGARVVISSAWRETIKKNRLQKILSRYGLQAVIYGLTPQIPDAVRGLEIDRWLIKHESEKIDSFVILDDRSDMAHLTPYLVQTDWDDGLQDVDVEKAVGILNNV